MEAPCVCKEIILKRLKQNRDNGINIFKYFHIIYPEEYYKILHGKYGVKNIDMYIVSEDLYSFRISNRIKTITTTTDQHLYHFPGSNTYTYTNIIYIFLMNEKITL